MLSITIDQFSLNFFVPHKFYNSIEFYGPLKFYKQRVSKE